MCYCRLCPIGRVIDSFHWERRGKLPVLCLFLLYVTPTQASSAPFACPCYSVCVLMTIVSLWTVALASSPICLLDFLPFVFFKDIYSWNFPHLSSLDFILSLIICVGGLCSHEFRCPWKAWEGVQSLGVNSQPWVGNQLRVLGTKPASTEDQLSIPSPWSTPPDPFALL